MPKKKIDGQKMFKGALFAAGILTAGGIAAHAYANRSGAESVQPPTEPQLVQQQVGAVQQQAWDHQQPPACPADHDQQTEELACGAQDGQDEDGHDKVNVCMILSTF